MFRRIAGRQSILVAVLLAGLSGPAVAAASPPRLPAPVPRLLFVSSYNPAFRSYAAQTEGLVEGLRENGFPETGYSLDTEFLDSKRFPYRQRAAQMRRDLGYKLLTLRPYDLVVAADDNALRFALDNADSLFRGAGIVFLGVNDLGFAAAQNGNPRVTGVVEHQSYAATLQLAAQLFPAARRIHAMTAGTTTTGKVNSRALEDALEHTPRPRGLSYRRHDLGEMTYDQFFAEMARVPAGEPVLLSALYRDANGESLDFATFMARLRAVYRGPIFSSQGHGVGAGVLGGKVVSHREQGRTAAALAARMLARAGQAAPPVVTASPNVYMFDWRELDRFGIPAARLPTGAVVRNRPRSVIAENARWVAGGLGALLLQAALIAVLLRSRHRRRLAEAARRESEARLHAFFDNSSEIMFVKDRDHRIVMANRRYLEFYGATGEETLGRRGGAGMPSDKRAKIEAHDDLVLATGLPTTQTADLRATDGGTRHFIMAKFPIVAPDGKIIAVGGINTDITDIERRKEELEDAKLAAERAAAEAQAANRTKSEFLANMSHEIRTPMNGVLGAANVLAATPLTERQRENVETIRESGTELLGLLNDILDLSKIEENRLELDAVDFSLPALLRATAGLWEPVAREKGLSFRIASTLDSGGIVRGDSTRLRQVLNNLIGNALKFTAEGGVEVAAAEEVRADGRVELRFEVRDSGIGIDAAAQARLFSPFMQADESTTRKYGGTGLGLSICRRLVELAGGEISVDSAPGKGAVFRFSMVADRGDAARVAAEAGPHSDLPPFSLPEGRKLRVLLAEDNAVNRRVAAWMLEPLDCTLDFAEDGLQAVAAVARSAYDIVLMDVQMPEMDGVAATARIRALPPPACDVPIVALTANAMRGDRERYLAAGMSDYVVKPIDGRDLFAAIGRCLDVTLAVPPPAMPAAPRRDGAGGGTDAGAVLPDGADEILGHLDRLMQSATG